MARIDAFLKLGVAQGCSDLHLAVGVPPMLRMHGDLSPIKFRNLGDAELESYITEVLTQSQLKVLRQGHDLDFSYVSSEGGRFRVNVYRKETGIGAAFRAIPTAIPTMEQLSLPPIVRKLCDYHQGMILVTGSTGTGKTTTLASMIDYLNSTRALNIISLEDPIEFVHRSKSSQVIQRELGTHLPSFAEGVRAAMREDPDVILVGEMRDIETIGTALHAAETGHMVFSTLHTLDAVETINRIIAVFPPPEQKQIRLQLAAVLRAVISQRLVRRCDGDGRVPAVEVMINTAYIRECILVPEKTRSIRDAISAGTSQYGMQTFDQSLWDLFQAGLINYETALENASNADDFKLRMQGIASTADISRQSMQSAGFGGR